MLYQYGTVLFVFSPFLTLAQFHLADLITHWLHDYCVPVAVICSITCSSSKFLLIGNSFPKIHWCKLQMIFMLTDSMSQKFRKYISGTTIFCFRTSAASATMTWLRISWKDISDSNSWILQQLRLRWLKDSFIWDYQPKFPYIACPTWPLHGF